MELRGASDGLDTDSHQPSALCNHGNPTILAHRLAILFFLLKVPEFWRFVKCCDKYTQ